MPSLVLLRQYPWPGNIRQLRNVIERLIITIGERSILLEHLPQEIRTSDKHVKTIAILLGSSLKDIEREVIRQTLVEVTHHREQAAKLLGMRGDRCNIKSKSMALNCNWVFDLPKWHTERIKFTMDLRINKNEGGLSCYLKLCKQA